MDLPLKEEAINLGYVSAEDFDSLGFSWWNGKNKTHPLVNGSSLHLINYNKLL
jgi:hypothetical protein